MTSGGDGGHLLVEREGQGVPEREAVRIDAANGTVVVASDDAREGPLAFVEKRTHRFTGR